MVQQLITKMGSLLGGLMLSCLNEGSSNQLPCKELLKDKKIDVVFCSDVQRAVKSATLTFGDTVPIMPDARLRECNYGEYNAKPSSIVEPLQETMITEPFPQGESYEDVKKRIFDFLDFLKQHHQGKNVGIVAHRGPQLALDVLLKGKTWETAFAQDWRKTKSWKPSWDYVLHEDISINATS